MPDDEHQSSSGVLAFLRALGLLALFILVQLVGGGLLAAVGAAPSLKGDVTARDAFALCALEAMVLLGALAVLLTHRDRTLGMRWRGSAAWRGTLPSLIAPLVVLGPGIAVAAAGSGSMLAPELTAAVALGFVLFAVLVGIAEELWFRGLIMETLDPRRHPWRAIVVSSVLFGLPHVIASSGGPTSATMLNAAAVTLAIAVPFACVRIVNGSIVPLIAWHAAIDIWAFLHTAGVTAEGNPRPAEAVAALLIPAVLSLGYLVWAHRRIGSVATNPRVHVD